MRRIELVKSINRLLDSINESKIIDILRMYVDMGGPRGPAEREPRVKGGPGSFQSEVMRSFRHYAISANGFGPIEHEFVKVFGLENLENPDFWGEVLLNPGPDLISYVDRASRGLKGLTFLRELMAVSDGQAPSESGKEPTSETLSIIIVEEKGHLSRPERLVKVLQGVTSLYEAHAFLKSVPANTLLVAACDSGSDMAFDFLGVAQAIEAVKETILSMWDRIVFFRQRKLLVNVRLVAEALPVLAEISALEERKAIEPEQAEILRRQVLDGATQLVEAGAFAPEVTGGSQRDFRALAAPEPKLLAAPQEAVSDSPPKDQQPRRKAKKKS